MPLYILMILVRPILIFILFISMRPQLILMLFIFMRLLLVLMLFILMPFRDPDLPERARDLGVVGLVDS